MTTLISSRRDPPWWKGARGEWLVAIQVALMALVFLAPPTVPGWPPFPLPAVAPYAGAALMVLGGVLLLASLMRLGPNLTPLPHPKNGATLVQTGPYRYVRHPMYASGLLVAFGWALLRQGWMTLIYSVIVLVFLDFKARREERWLRNRFPEYPEYSRRTRKLIPFVY